MDRAGYSEEQLITNRAAVLVHGGTQAERRAWAEEAAGHFSQEGLLQVVDSAAALERALTGGRGTVFVPDLIALGGTAQSRILRCLVSQEERPKLVLGVSSSPTQALSDGRLRGDLLYRLAIATVDLSGEALKETIRARRAKAQAAAPKAATSKVPAKGERTAPQLKAGKSVKR